MGDIHESFGALMVGGIIAAMLSGVVTAQAFSYFKYYVNDRRSIKALVGVVWFLDVWHTIFLSSALWDYLIAHFGDVSRIDYLPWSLAMTIILTATLTFLVHLFFVYRIFKLSLKNFGIAIPLTLLVCARLCFACLTTVKMMQLRSWNEFRALYTWSFSCGLALCSLLDLIFTTLLCYFLLQNHKRHSSMNGILDSLMLYAFENGSLSCAAALTSLVCWVTMPNLIFMGIHFVISKLYGNNLLATLNARKNLRQVGRVSHLSERNQAIVFSDSVDHSQTMPSLTVKVDQTQMSKGDANFPMTPVDVKTSEESF